MDRFDAHSQAERQQQHSLQCSELIADERQQNSQWQKEREIAERVSQAKRHLMVPRIQEEALDRIPKRNEVYVIRMRVLEAGYVSRNDRKRGNYAEVEDERSDQKLGFDARLQSGDRIQKMGVRKQ